MSKVQSYVFPFFQSQQQDELSEEQKAGWYYTHMYKYWEMLWGDSLTTLTFAI